MTKRKPTAKSRLSQDYLRLKNDPIPYITAEPLPSNILEWHYVIKGPEESPYFGGYYHGKLLFPREFPFRPPSIYILTPNGRFQTNIRLCLSISDYHPKTWNPAWSVATILTGLLSFMLEQTATYGSIDTTDHIKKQLAYRSLEYNLKNTTFCELFPDIRDEIKNILITQMLSNGTNNMIGNSCCSDVRLMTDDVSTPPANDLNLYIIKNNNNNNNNNNNINNVENKYWDTLYSNLIVMISFVIFALIVNHIIKNLYGE